MECAWLWFWWNNNIFIILFAVAESLTAVTVQYIPGDYVLWKYMFTTGVVVDVYSVGCRLQHIIDLLENDNIIEKDDLIHNLKYSIAVLDTLYIEETK